MLRHIVLARHSTPTWVPPSRLHHPSRSHGAAHACRWRCSTPRQAPHGGDWGLMEPEWGACLGVARRNGVWWTRSVVPASAWTKI